MSKRRKYSEEFKREEGSTPQLQVERTFPELLRVPVLGKLIQRALTADRTP